MKIARSFIWRISVIYPTFAPVMTERRERVRSLLHLSPPILLRLNAQKQKQSRQVDQIMESQVKMIEAKAVELLADDPEYFIVETVIRPANNIKVVVDADQGATIDRLSKLNRALYKWIEETLIQDGDFSLEVSSPGLDEPLKLHRQYVKNIGRPVTVVLHNGETKEGTLISVTAEGIVLEEMKARRTGEKGKGKGKKKEPIQHSIVHNEIKSTKIQIRI